ncbi:MAG: FecR family protein [Sphingobacteriales bacterium]|nr:MAG: FecR family protein [Sphingobacteriales bacterium]
MDRIWILMARRLAGEITPAEQLELENLLRTNPDTHYPLETISDIWKQDVYDNLHRSQEDKKTLSQSDNTGLSKSGKPGLLPQDEPDAETEDAWNKHLARLQQAVPADSARSRRNYLPVAIVLLAVLAIFYLVRPTAPSLPAQAPHSELITKPGSKTSLVLPDGSRVWLNADSKLTYGSGYGKTDREVHLTGEAYFDVKKDSARPFLIHTTNMDLKVLGTKFNVKSYPGEATSEAALISGSLEISLTARNKQKIVLLPNEKLVVANKSPDNLKTTSKLTLTLPLISIKNITRFERDDRIIVETSWIQNKLAFQDEKFSDIALKMEKWFAVPIMIEDSALPESLIKVHSSESRVNGAPVQKVQMSRAMTMEMCKYMHETCRFTAQKSGQLLDAGH